MTNRSRYGEIGERAVRRLAEHLEKSGHLVKIMNGSYGEPDLIYGKYAVEVKHVQFLYRKMTGNKQYVQFGDFMCSKKAWYKMVSWARNNGYEPIMIAVTEISRKVRIFLEFNEVTINKLMLRNEPSVRMHVPSWEMLMIGVRI